MFYIDEVVMNGLVVVNCVLGIPCTDFSMLILEAKKKQLRGK